MLTFYSNSLFIASWYYNAAESILVSEGALNIDLTEDGGRELKLAELICFDCGAAVASEFRDARKVFKKMAMLEWGQAIQFA